MIGKLKFLIILLGIGLLGFEPGLKEPKSSKSNIPKQNLIDSNCKYKGFKMYGKIKVVESFPDVKVQVVESFPDLKVKIVTSFPDHCGEWQYVESFPETKIQFVTSFPDIKVQFVESFPGKTK
jgi:hypothetical protein